MSRQLPDWQRTVCLVDLTSGAFVAVLIIVAVALLTVLVLGWPGSPRRWLRRTIRGVEAILLNAVVLLLAGALLNDQYLFYENWGDLLGSSPTVVASSVAGAAPKIAAAAPVGNAFAKWKTPPALPPLPSPGARLQTYRIPGAAPGKQHTVIVYLPAGYRPSSATTYPVLVGLPGLPSSPRAWLSAFNIDTTLDGAVAAHRIAAPILVLPQVNEPKMLDTECVDSPSPSGPQVDSWLSTDLPRWVATHFRVKLNRASWAIMGYSYGGWCAAAQLVRHPDVYGAGMVFEGYFHPEFVQSFTPFTPGSPQYDAYDLAKVAAAKRPPIAMWVLAAKGDKNSYTSTEQFLAAVKPPTSITADILSSGAHRVSVYRPFVPTAIRWLGASVAAFSASSAGA